MAVILADRSVSLWCSEVTQNEEDISYMFDDEVTTPVKACGDLALHVGQNGINIFLNSVGLD